MPATRASVLGVALLFAASHAPAARADTLYKCIDATGLTTIQTAPCAKGQTQAWARPTTPEPPPTPEQLAARQARREQAEREAAAHAAAQAEEAAQAERAAAEAAMKREVEDTENAQADAAAKRAGVDAAAPTPPAPDTGEAILEEKAVREKKCADAKEFAVQLRAKPWLNLDDAQWQRVYGWVVQECR